MFERSATQSTPCWTSGVAACRRIPIQCGEMKPILRKIREHGAFTAVCIYLLYVIHYLLVFLLDILSLHPELEWLFYVSYWLDFTWLYFFLPT